VDEDIVEFNLKITIQIERVKVSSAELFTHHSVKIWVEGGVDGFLQTFLTLTRFCKSERPQVELSSGRFETNTWPADGSRE